MTSELDRLQLALPKRYKLVRELDRGGMSRVYLAREEMPDRDVAIKVFDEKLSAQLGRARFLREVEITSQLGHPYIVPIHSAGDAEGALYYVMPFIRGESLRDRLEREGRLPVEDALKITEQVAGALAHAHEKGVIHRDIKPSNILFHGGHAVVADFGIARALSAAENRGTLTHAGTSLGTPDYMSPEQISGETEVDVATDIYALACVLYEMLGGQPPFHSRTRQATLARHLADTVPSLGGLRDAIPHEIESAIRRSLAKAPVDRFASVTEFVQALRPTLGQLGVSRPPQGKQWIPPWAVSWRLAGVLLVATALGVAWNVWSVEAPSGVIAGSPDADATPQFADSVAISPFENLTVDPALDSWGRLLADDASELLTGMDDLRVRNSYSVVTLSQTLPVLLLMDSLNIGTLIQGTIRPRGDWVQVSVQVTDAQGDIEYTTPYEPFRPASADSALRAIAYDVARTYLRRRGLTGTLAFRDGSSSPATDAYLAGNEGLGQRTPEGIRNAVLSFRQAIDLDPEYAPPYAGLASAYALALYYKYDVGLSAHALAGEGLALADRAVELDQAHDGGYSARGLFRALIGMEIDEAEIDFETAQTLAPSRSNAAGWSARIEAQRGETSAAYDLYSEALSLDPQNAGRRIGFVSLALQLGEYAVVVENATAALELEEALSLAAAFHGWALALDGRGEDCLRLEFGVYDLVQAICMDATGREEEALAVVESAEASFPSTPSDYLDVVQAQGLMLYYGYVGDAEKATEWLHVAFDRSPAPVDPRIIDSPLMAPVRTDDTFEAAYQQRRQAARERVVGDRQRARDGLDRP